MLLCNWVSANRTEIVVTEPLDDACLMEVVNASAGQVHKLLAGCIVLQADRTTVIRSHEVLVVGMTIELCFRDLRYELQVYLINSFPIRAMYEHVAGNIHAQPASVQKYKADVYEAIHDSHQHADV